jgi:hypothetical protein
MNLKFDEEPMYAALIALFEPLLGGFGSNAVRPLQVDQAVKVRCCLCACCSTGWAVRAGWVFAWALGGC